MSIITVILVWLAAFAFTASLVLALVYFGYHHLFGGDRLTLRQLFMRD